MLSNDLKQILLLHPVRVNRTLKKFEKPSDEMTNSINTYLNETFVLTTDQWLSNSNSNIWDGVNFITKRNFRESWKVKLANFYIKLRLTFDTADKLKPSQFFNLVKDNFSELDDLSSNQLFNIEKELKSFYDSKQKNIYELLNAQYQISKIEKILKDNGISQYQSEEDLIKFIRQSEAGLCLIELESFRYEIPSEVTEKINKSEDLKVFDNYYILYKDPDFKKNIFKYAEVDKDPIVFGVINGSTKLYYIADWISDFCDLTYDKIIEKTQNSKL